MSISYCLSDDLKKLGMLIEDGKKIILFDCSDMKLLKSIVQWIIECKIDDLVIWQSIEKSLTDEYVEFISKKTMCDIVSMYHMYDFSDKVLLVSNITQYGNLFNYVNTGILTKQEMVDALLYKI